jgi:predicted transcriptional regulator
MTPNPVSVSPLESLEEILHLFTHHHFNWLPVTENDKFYGVIYQDDVVKTLFSTVDMEETIAPAAVSAAANELEEKH